MREVKIRLEQARLSEGAEALVSQGERTTTGLLNAAV